MTYSDGVCVYPLDRETRDYNEMHDLVSSLKDAYQDLNEEVDGLRQELLSRPSEYSASSGAAVGFVPIGSVIAWHGNTSSIPYGWSLCDGTHQTPNLLDKFVVAAGTAGGGLFPVGGNQDGYDPSGVLSEENIFGFPGKSTDCCSGGYTEADGAPHFTQS
jgi:hypothetical protein